MYIYNIYNTCIYIIIYLYLLIFIRALLIMLLHRQDYEHKIDELQQNIKHCEEECSQNYNQIEVSII